MTAPIWTARLVVAIVTTISQEVAIALIVLLGLPQIGVKIPVSGVVAILIVWGAIAISLYRAGSVALTKKPVTGLPNMVDSRGKVVSTLNPKGVVKVRGELWDAMAADGKRINRGEEIIVVAQDRLRLTVSRYQKKN